MKEFHLWNFVLSELRRNEPVFLITVVDYEKGSPGKTGFKLAVSARATHGTVGGGIMEFNLIRQSREFIAEKKEIRIVRKLVHVPKPAHGEPSGLICAGSETICMMSLFDTDVTTADKVVSALDQYFPAHLLYSREGLSFHEKKNPRHAEFVFKDEDDWSYKENVGEEYTVYVIGGGHVGLAVTKLMQTLNVNLILIDDRNDSPAMKDTGISAKKIVCPYDAIGSHLREDEKSFVVIVTSAMPSDRTVLREIGNRKFGYIGLMGTQAKISQIFKAFADEGKPLPGNIHAPIGIEIESETPEEIAVSIAAEVIKTKNIKENSHTARH
jgi:xanthine dehydrogenase accessory factor